jgi:hypothetical protein
MSREKDERGRRSVDENTAQRADSPPISTDEIK